MTASFLIGIDIGGTKCASVLANPAGELLSRRSILTRAGERGPDKVLAELITQTKSMLTEHQVGREKVRGIGVSCGGPLDTKAGVLLRPPNLPEWEGVKIKEILEQAFDLPVTVENDANATALAEWKLGAGRGAQNLIFMTVGTGIGGGLILDGRLYRGTNDLAGELGHQTILQNGPICGCGKRGCLEALASGPAIARLARESMMYGRHKRVLTLAGGSPSDITAQHVIQAAQEGDTFGRQILEEAGFYLGIGIANLIQILNPEVIILGTIAVHAGDLILEPVRNAVAEYAWQRSHEVCRIVPAELGDRAQDLAAIALLMNAKD